MGYDNPPYKPGTKVQEIELLEDATFIRVYDGDTSGQFGVCTKLNTTGD